MQGKPPPFPTGQGVQDALHILLAMDLTNLASDLVRVPLAQLHVLWASFPRTRRGGAFVADLDGG